MLTWLGGGGGWRSKRFPVIVAQRGWYSASTSWHYACTISQATQQARGRRFVGTLAWSTYKLCPATVAQPQKLLYEHGVGVVGTLAWSTYKLCTATVAQPLNLTTCTGLAWSARWRGQRINGDLLRWHNPTVCQTSITRHGQLGRWVGSALRGISGNRFSGVNVGLSRRMAIFNLRLTYLINNHLSSWSVR